MLAEYLQKLKAKCGYSWTEIEERSGIPEITARKIIKGETETPRIDTVIALVTALGGELNGIIDDTDIINVKKDIIPLIESYECRLRDKDERIKSLKKDKRTFMIVSGVLVAFIILMLVIDILIGSRGWIVYK